MKEAAPPNVSSPPAGTHISEVEGNFQVVPEEVAEVGVHVQHLQQVISEDLVKVAVGQSPDISVRFTRPSVQVDRLAKYVILSCRNSSKTKYEQGGEVLGKRRDNANLFKKK